MTTALDVTNVRRFIEAGKARFTVVSKKTGARFTYHVVKAKDGKIHFVRLLTGPDNTANYTYLGIIRNGRFELGRKSRVGASAPSVRGFEWLWRNVDKLDARLVEVYHEGRCCRCGRPLTVPESIRSGIGPECAGKMGGALVVGGLAAVIAREKEEFKVAIAASARAGAAELARIERAEAAKARAEADRVRRALELREAQRIERAMQEMEAAADREQSEREARMKEDAKAQLEWLHRPVRGRTVDDLRAALAPEA